jgi:hypothetical protein
MNRWDYLGMTPVFTLPAFVVHEKPVWNPNQYYADYDWSYQQYLTDLARWEEVFAVAEDEDPRQQCVDAANERLRSSIRHVNFKYNSTRDAIISDYKDMVEFNILGDRIIAAWKFAGASVLTLGVGAAFEAGATALTAQQLVRAQATLDATVVAANSGKLGSSATQLINLAATEVVQAKQVQTSAGITAVLLGGFASQQANAARFGLDNWTPVDGMQDLGDRFMSGGLLEIVDIASDTVLPTLRLAETSIDLDLGKVIPALRTTRDLYQKNLDQAHQASFDAILDCYKE